MRALAILALLAVGDTRPARWARADLPIQVLVAPEALDHHGAIARAAVIINRAAGCEVFAFPRAATLVYVKDFLRGGHGIAGHIMVRADGEAEPPRAHLEPVFGRWRRIHSAVLTLPRARLEEWQLRAAVVHELRHAAGLLGHEDRPDSLGFEVLLPDQAISERTRRWLREAYCR